MTTTTPSLTAWLLAQIAEDERGAREDLVGRRYPDPARVLRQCEALREVVALHPHRDCSEYERTWGDSTFGCATCHEFDGIVMAGGNCPTLRALARIYADREGAGEWL